MMKTDDRVSFAYDDFEKRLLRVIFKVVKAKVHGGARDIVMDACPHAGHRVNFPLRMQLIDILRTKSDE